MNAKTAKTALDKFRGLTFSHGMDGAYPSLWSGVYFTERGMGRLMNIAGYITALSETGNEDLANHLANDLDRRLTYLSEYGGTYEVEGMYRSGPVMGKAEVKRYVVVLHDDGTFGGFGVGWYRHVSDAQRYEGIEDEDCDPALENGSFRRSFPGRRALETMYKSEDGHLSWLDLYYKFAFNGGLLLHGMGTSPFAVDLINDNGPHWSIHT